VSRTKTQFYGHGSYNPRFKGAVAQAGIYPDPVGRPEALWT